TGQRTERAVGAATERAVGERTEAAFERTGAAVELPESAVADAPAGPDAPAARSAARPKDEANQKRSGSTTRERKRDRADSRTLEGVRGGLAGQAGIPPTVHSAPLRQRLQLN